MYTAMFCIFSGCQTDNTILETSIEKKVFRLADKYHLNLKMSESQKENKINIDSFEELELIFQALTEQRKRKVSKKFKVTKYEKDHFLVQTINEPIQEPENQRPIFAREDNLRSVSYRSAIGRIRKWFYDLTWFNVTIAYHKNFRWIDPVSINSFYTGIHPMSYTQLSSASNVLGQTICFCIQGIASMTFSIGGIVDINETRPIRASGRFDTNTKTGVLDLSGNGYWFHQN